VDTLSEFILACLDRSQKVRAQRRDFQFNIICAQVKCISDRPNRPVGAMVISGVSVTGYSRSRSRSTY